MNKVSSGSNVIVLKFLKMFADMRRSIVVVKKR